MQSSRGLPAMIRQNENGGFFGGFPKEFAEKMYRFLGGAFTIALANGRYVLDDFGDNEFGLFLM